MTQRRWLWEVTCRAIEPDIRFRPMRRIALLARLVWHWPLVRGFAPSVASGALGRDMATRPEMLGAAVWPYLCASWSPARRLVAIADHYRLVDRCFPMLDFPHGQALGLLSLEPWCAGLRLVLDKPRWFLREGQLVINLFLADERLFSLAFSLGRQGDDVVAYVGAVQGVRGDGVTDAYRELTKALHGMRPRDFLIDVFRELCGALGVGRVLAVRDHERHHRHAYFGRGKADELVVDYDTVWTERGAVPGPAPEFLELSAAFNRRDLETIAPRKRALYRRRYEALDAMAAELRQACDARQRLARQHRPPPPRRPGATVPATQPRFE